MESQVIRDSLLRLTGDLNTTMNGPSLDPQTKEPPLRRSVYFKHSRDDQHAFLSMFDDADIFACYRRRESVVPQQALALANSRLSLEMAARLAQRLVADMPRSVDSMEFENEFITHAFELILCRQPTAEERTVCLAALAEWRQLRGEDAAAVDTGAAAQEYRNLVHALLNHNDFITIR
jgi:hypothetical protein